MVDCEASPHPVCDGECPPDEVCEPIPGANVVLEGTLRGTTTDADGYYLILLVDPGLYVMTVLMFPALHLIAVIEERELHERFGDAYAEYCAAVPRLIPRSLWA